MQSNAVVKIDLAGLEQYQALLNADLRRTGNGPIRDALHQWAARYRAFLQERFDKASKGGGDWKPLAESTQRRRRKARKGHASRKRGGSATRVFAILRDTGTLFAALTPAFARKPGQLQEDIPFGVRVGYGGPHKHPGNLASIADIAHFHQIGAGNLPVRKIIVPPDDQLKPNMAQDMQAALIKLAKTTDRKQAQANKPI